MQELSRREMIAASTGVAGFTFLPAQVLGRGGAIPPSEKFNVAFVGIGQRGSFHVREIANLGHNLVAFADVDWRQVTRGPVPGGRQSNPNAIQIAEKFPNVKRYDDWRIMLQEQDKNIDGVVVATPDHDHAVVSIAAMKMGKHVYCEKPMAHSVEECRAIEATAAKYPKLTTQVGCQGHSSEPMRMMVETIKAGGIGEVRQMIVIGNGAPQTIAGRQKKFPAPAFDYADIPKILAEQHDVPDELKWDLWLGPAPNTAFNPKINPGWRRWRTFGDGSIGDIICHYFDCIAWALDVRLPDTVQCNCDEAYNYQTNKWTIPWTQQVNWHFPARGKLPPLEVNWYYGKEAGEAKLPDYWKWDYWPKLVEGGVLPVADMILIVGSKGAFAFGNPAVGMPRSALTGEYQTVLWTPPEGVRLIPDELGKTYKYPTPSLPRPFNHWWDWIESAKAGKQSGAPFSYGGPMSECGLLANLAASQKGKVLKYDAKTGTFPGNDEATRLTKLTYRQGFNLTT